MHLKLDFRFKKVIYLKSQFFYIIFELVTYLVITAWMIRFCTPILWYLFGHSLVNKTIVNQVVHNVLWFFNPYRFFQKVEWRFGWILRNRTAVEVPARWGQSLRVCVLYRLRWKLLLLDLNECFSHFSLAPKDIDYEGFKLFMDTYLEVETQEELCKRLFLSFVKRTPTKTVSSVEGKVIKVIMKGNKKT